MNPDTLLPALGGLLSLIVSALTLFLREQLSRGKTQSYGERLSELTASLTKSSREVDSVLQELAKVGSDRQRAVVELEGQLSALESRERELTEKVKLLEDVPMPVAEHFARLIEKGEKRSARRDYMLFGAGVLVSTVVTLVLQRFGG